MAKAEQSPLSQNVGLDLHTKSVRYAGTKQEPPYPSKVELTGFGERQTNMATMTVNWSQLDDVSFEDVEENVELVRVGVKFANRAGFIVRVIWKFALLANAFAEAIERQGRLIDKINGPIVQQFSVIQLGDLATRIEHLIQLNDELLEIAAPRTREFSPWMKMLADIRVQRDTLESIAESLRSATDPEHQALLVMAMETVSA